VVGIILATGCSLILTGLIPEIRSIFTQGIGSYLVPHWKVALMFGSVFLVRFLWRVWKKKVISPILSIGISAVLGILIYGV